MFSTAIRTSGDERSVPGIAGIDPEDGPIGSAVWADWVVDGDLGHAIDAREVRGWSTFRDALPR